MKRKLNKRNLLKLFIMSFCIGIFTYYSVCIGILFATFTWLGFLEYIIAFTVGIELYEDLFMK